MTRQVFRYGVEFVPQGDSWRLSSGEGVKDAKGLLTSCGPTPILIEQDNRNGEPTRTSLLTPAMQHFGLETTWLLQRFMQPGAGIRFRQWHEVVYLLDAVGYHFANLAEAYARVRKHWVRIDRIPGPDGTANRDQAGFTGASEGIWFELDALLTAARRTLDISRFSLWNEFGTKSPCPRNFPNTLKQATSMPEALHEHLNGTWIRFGLKLTEYRDCIQHNTSLTRGADTIHVDRRAHGIWLVSAWLPDNPETKTHAKFTYTNKLDALNYAHTVTFQWLDAMKAMARHISPHPDFDAL